MQMLKLSFLWAYNTKTLFDGVWFQMISNSSLPSWSSLSTKHEVLLANHIHDQSPILLVLRSFNARLNPFPFIEYKLAQKYILMYNFAK